MQHHYSFFRLTLLRSNTAIYHPGVLRDLMWNDHDLPDLQVLPDLTHILRQKRSSRKSCRKSDLSGNFLTIPYIFWDVRNYAAHITFTKILQISQPHQDPQWGRTPACENANHAREKRFVYLLKYSRCSKNISQESATLWDCNAYKVQK